MARIAIANIVRIAHMIKIYFFLGLGMSLQSNSYTLPIETTLPRFKGTGTRDWIRTPLTVVPVSPKFTIWSLPHSEIRMSECCLLTEASLMQMLQPFELPMDIVFITPPLMNNLF